LPSFLWPRALERKDGRGLRHRLDDEHARHHREVREVPGKERLVDGDVLDRRDAHVLLEGDDAIDEEERVAVRQVFLDFLNRHFAHCGLPGGAAGARRARRCGAGTPRS
jgi:hypothetical protein